MESTRPPNVDQRAAGRVDLAAKGGVFGWRAAVGCAFFGLFYVWVWQFVQPQLLYHCDQVFLLWPDVLLTFPLFQKGWVFFEPFAMRVGGLGEYAGAFLSQYFYWGWLGSLILTGGLKLPSLADK